MASTPPSEKQQGAGQQGAGQQGAGQQGAGQQGAGRSPECGFRVGVAVLLILLALYAAYMLLGRVGGDNIR